MNIESFIKQNVLDHSSKEESLEVPFPTFKRIFKKGEVITRFNQIERKGYLLISGIIQCSIQKDGNERIIDFIFPDNFTCAYDSFLQDTPSNIELSALTDCEVEYLNKEDVKKAYKTSIVANQFGRFLKEKVLLEKLAREKDFLTKTAEENYHELVKNRPEIIREIPVNKIAKYLGIHPESLSRIRAKVIS